MYICIYIYVIYIYILVQFHIIMQRSTVKLRKDAPYRTAKDELWGVCHEYFGENSSRYNVNVYIYIVLIIDSADVTRVYICFATVVTSRNWDLRYE